MTVPLAIDARSLARHYGEGNRRVDALKNATFEIARGEVVAILGPSGSGKTTLLTVLGLINPPDAGSLRIDGHEVLREGARVTNLALFRRRYLGFVFQRSNLIPFLNALENVQLSLELDDVPPREARGRAREILTSLGLAERLDYVPAILSGGEQQRVAIARALVNAPAVVLADEPTAALDSERGRQIMEIFRRAARERGAAILFVTHDHRTLDLVDRVIEMEDGALTVRAGGST
ncbi:MAG: ABC transporter ATP-binding protein [Planctomycetes bacterium]|nr:ABC transporter ATP-binding protein [Planctomycetota bacterium]MBI3846346.1 ABC transporter ATP-binding protein [Planctomycetota bacterium]